MIKKWGSSGKNWGRITIIRINYITKKLTSVKKEIKRVNKVKVFTLFLIHK